MSNNQTISNCFTFGSLLYKTLFISDSVFDLFVSVDPRASVDFLVFKETWGFQDCRDLRGLLDQWDSRYVLTFGYKSIDLHLIEKS